MPELRDIEHRNSALPDAMARSYGQGTRGIDPGDVFSDIGADPAASHDAAPVTRTTVTPMAAPPQPTATPSTQPTSTQAEPPVPPQAPEPDAAPATPATQEPSAPPLGTAPAEEVEVEQSELDYLRSIAQDAPDSLIAKMLSYRKGNSTLQSRIDKVKAIFGPDIVTAIERGEVPELTGRLLNDLRDATFERYVADFYASHELRDGAYVRTRALAPAPDLLAEYATLALEKASLNMGAFMGPDEDFDANDAMTNRASASGKALAKFQTREREIESRMAEIAALSQSTPTGDTQATPEAAAKAKQAAIDTLVTAHADLRDAQNFERFRTFVANHQAEPLEIYYQAYSFATQRNARVQRLVVTELDTVRRNLDATGTPGKVAANGAAAPGNIDPSQTDMIKADAAYFGDPLN